MKFLLSIAALALGAVGFSQVALNFAVTDQAGVAGDTLNYRVQLSNLSSSDINLIGFDPGLGDAGFAVNNTLLDDLYNQTSDFVLPANQVYELAAFDVMIEPTANLGTHYGLSVLDFQYIDPLNGQLTDGQVSTNWTLSVDSSTVPEPASLAVLGLGLAFAARKKKRSSSV